MRALVIAVLVSSMAGAAADAAAAGTVTIPSRISIRGDGLDFRGKVRASNDACEGGRKVVLYRRFSNGDSQPLGSTTTSASGKWHISASGSAGITMSHFFAKVRKRTDGTAGTTFICQKARSRTIPYQP